MKKILLVCTGIVMMTISGMANSQKETFFEVNAPNYDSRTIHFSERGTQFRVYLNGDFEWRSMRNGITYDYNGYRSNRRNRWRMSPTGFNRTRILGDVRIVYDHRGNVTRIGRVTLKYRFGKLVRLGGLRIDYAFGRPRFIGSVKSRTARRPIHRPFRNYGGVYVYHDPFFTGPIFRTHFRKFKQDRYYTYYRSNSRQYKNQIVKRKRNKQRRSKRRSQR